MIITPRMALEVAAHEALIRQTYRDSVGVDTWSVGLTSASGHDVTRYIGKPQSVEHCLRIFVWALQRYADQVDEAFKGRVLTDAQSTAALSFHWNTGAINRASWVKKWLAGDVKGARKSFMAWKKPPHIVERREKERDLFFDGVWTGKTTMGEYTKLTKKRTPVWSSRIEIDVKDTLERLLDSAPIDHVPATEIEPQGLWAAIAAIVLNIFGGKKNG